MEKRTKIIVIVLLLIVIAGIIGISLLPSKAPSIIELEILPHSEDNSKEPLFQLRSNNAASWQAWNNRLNQFLKDYHDSAAQVERVVCSYDISISGGEKACEVPLDNLYPCAGSSNFESTSTCIFLRLSKIANWTPEVYNNTMGLPKNMPEDLKMYIKVSSDTPKANNVWVSCKGETPADEELIGPVQYLPRRGFPAYYFPYTNKKGYLSPMVAVLFERPKLGIMVNVVCTAWAKNIKNNAEEEQATARFSLIVD